MWTFSPFSYSSQFSNNNDKNLEIQIVKGASRNFTGIFIPRGLLGIYGMTLNVEIFEISAYTHVY